jgi:predicted ATP-binding protein involved in virulence
MKLTEITIENYRCFERLNISFHPEVTVLIAPNAAGKTTIIDAARIAMWPLVKAFDLGSQTGKSATIQIEDVRLTRRDQNNMEAVIPSIVDAQGIWPGESEEKHWIQTREKLKSGTNTLQDEHAKALTKLGKKLQNQVRDEKNLTAIDLPLIVYLGTGRLWYQGRYTSTVADKKLDKSMQSRLWGYQNCLTAASSYKQFEDWYGWVYKSYRELQIQQLEGSDYFDAQYLEQFKAAIQVVKQSVNALTQKATGWHDIEYSVSQRQQLVMNHPVHGALPLSMLSDGLRNMVVMVSDIAFRCIKLNPHFGEQAALKTEGVVMIDEVDMFLHPSWQQTVIGSLREAFPNIQFILTTHSPQVLSTVPKECIRVLGTNAEGENIAATPLAASYGEPSNDVLQAIMHVDPQPPVPEKALLDELTSLVDQGEYQNQRAVLLLSNLKQILNDQHPQIQKIERSIRRQEALKG